MQHPFDLSLSELAAIAFTTQTSLTDQQAEEISGGTRYTTLAVGEEGGGTGITQALYETGSPMPWPPMSIPRPPIAFPCSPPGDSGEMTTMAVGEEGGGFA